MLAPLLDRLKRQPQRTWSIVITIFGDAVLPRGGCIWLGTLLEIFAAMDIPAGAVRTAMSRLTADGWIERSRVGRNSFYRLAAKGHDTFAAAADRIYGAPPEWDGQFRLVLSPKNRPALEEAGYGPAAPGLWVAPGPLPPPAEPLAMLATLDPAAAQRLTALAWPLDRIANAYARFNTAFAPLRNGPGEPTELDALIARTLLVHEYRRIVLHARLPLAILPQPWPGAEARALCAAAYAALLPASEAWLDAHAQSETGPLPPPDPTLWSRFSV
ncbi:MAG: PaaX family transcriptional regulator C-terminal domain-containing protein [Acetobacteraceae bacterium]